jgi:hypothetical protein
VVLFLSVVVSLIVGARCVAWVNCRFVGRSSVFLCREVLASVVLEEWCVVISHDRHWYVFRVWL